MPKYFFSWSSQSTFGFSKFLCSCSYQIELPSIGYPQSYLPFIGLLLLKTSSFQPLGPASPQHFRFGDSERSIHSFTYLLLISGFRRVLEYSFNYSPSTRVINYSVSAALNVILNGVYPL